MELMKSTFFDTLFESVCRDLKENDVLDQVSNDFKKQTSDRGRVGFLLGLKSIQASVKLPDDLAAMSSKWKCSRKSENLREDGNKLFKAKNYHAAVRAYTDSLRFAPMCADQPLADNTASLAFANRSAALFQLKEYSTCIDDINCALRVGYPENLRYKLYDRQGQCLKELGRYSEALNCFTSAKDAVSKASLSKKQQQHVKSDIELKVELCRNSSNINGSKETNEHSDIRAKCEQSVPSLRHGTCSQYPSLSGACNVAYSPERGRYIVATQDIMPGEVVLVEKPFASIVLSENKLDHCDHCYKETIAPVPCTHCNSALYCSASCSTQSWTLYHSIECLIRGFLEQSGVDKFALLAFRTVVKSGFSILYQTVSSVSNLGVALAGCDEDGKYQSESYQAICTLVTHAEDRNAHDLFRRSIIAIFLLRCLEFAGFFSPDNCTPDSTAVVGGMLLSHLQSFPCNAHEISEFDLVTDAVEASVPHELGAGIYATLSLFNHSCNPAVTRNFYGETCVVRAIRTVKAGEEVSDNYGAVFAIQTRDERRIKLKPQYFFECSCEACTGNWPLLFTGEQNMKPPHWRCVSCGHALLPSTMECPECKQTISIKLYMDQLSVSHTSYQKAFDKLLKKCDVRESLPVFLSHLTVMDKLLCLPWMDYSACQEAVKQCFSIMANCRTIHKSMT